MTKCGTAITAYYSCSVLQSVAVCCSVLQCIAGITVKVSFNLMRQSQSNWPLSNGT